MVNISEHVEMADITGLAPGVDYTFTVTALYDIVSDKIDAHNYV